MLVVAALSLSDEEAALKRPGSNSNRRRIGISSSSISSSRGKNRLLLESGCPRSNKAIRPPLSFRR